MTSTEKTRLTIAITLVSLVAALTSAPAADAAVHSQFATESIGTVGGCEATGVGTLTEGSATVTALKTTCGTFEPGQPIAGTAQGVVPSGTTVVAVGTETLTLSKPAEGTGARVGLSARAHSFTAFSGGALAIAGASLYVLDGEQGTTASPGVLYGFDVSAPPANPPLGGCLPFNLGPDPRGGSPKLAVDRSGTASDGNVYYASAGSGGTRKVYGFSAACAPLPGFPIAAPQHTEGKSVFAPEISGLAVDPSGHLWLSNEKWIEHYNSSGVKLGEIAVGAQGTTPGALDFDAAGNLYVVNESSTWRYEAPSFDSASVFADERGQALTVDRATGDVYELANSSQEVLHYDPAGNLVEAFGARTKGAYSGLALNEASGVVYTADQSASLVDAFAIAGVPGASTGAASDPGPGSVVVNGKVQPGGHPLTGCRFEWVTDGAFRATGFNDLSSGGEAACEPDFATIPADNEEHDVHATATNLVEGTAYRFRLVAENANGPSPGRAAGFALGPPEVETVGSPLRSATTARFDSRLFAHGLSTEYHFEYGDQGPCDANPCTATPTETATNESVRLVSAVVGGLMPSATYHYRLVADNGGPGGAAAGADMTLTTRPSDEALSHGGFAGPPESDRAWERVSASEAGGNPVSAMLGMSRAGNRLVYQLLGGTQSSATGSLFNDFVVEKTPSGWEQEPTYPSRAEAPFSGWFAPAGDDDLNTLLTLNIEAGVSAQAGAVWRLTPSGPPAKLYELPPGQYGAGNGSRGLYLFADNGSRALLVLNGSPDPAHPAPPSSTQLYDVTSGSPKLVDLLPGDTVPSCGVLASGDVFVFPDNDHSVRTSHWLSSDGSKLFFPSAGNSVGCSSFHLYLRDLVAGTTVQVDGSPSAGPECSGAFIRSTAKAAYFWTQADLAPSEDTPVASCDGQSNGDVYRFDIATHGYECLTCGSWGSADVPISAQALAVSQIAVSSDESHLYFKSPRTLLPGANQEGIIGLYRMRLPSGGLAYVGPVGGAQVGDEPPAGSALSDGGAFFAFASADQGLDSLTGSHNGGTLQYYVYDDGDRSLSCVSCPADGSKPRGPVPSTALALEAVSISGVGPHITTLANNGTFAFATPTPLAVADQNTAPSSSPNSNPGEDVYEWRDGRQLLISDGATKWPLADFGGPRVAAIAPDGRNVFFLEAAQLTPDTPDAFRRLFDACIVGPGCEPTYRSSGGETTPCSLESCQGTPNGSPSAQTPGSSTFSGPGNVRKGRACPRGKVRRKGHCVVKHRKRKAHHQGHKKKKHHASSRAAGR